MIRQVEWHVEPGGDSAKDKEAAEFVESCMDDMQATWTDTIAEILSFLPYGWSFHEIVYKRRMGKTKNRRSSSKYSDGLIGWRKLPPRAQDTLYRWEYDDSDNLIGMTQQPPPDYGLFTIPMSKAMLFRTESVKDNPEGRSILRNAYRSRYFKRRIQKLKLSELSAILQVCQLFMLLKIWKYGIVKILTWLKLMEHLLPW